MKTRDYFAGQAGMLLSSTLTAEETATIAYDVADAMMAERAKRQSLYGPDAPERPIDLNSYPSTSCQNLIEAELLAGELLRSLTPFHVEQSNDVWVFTVLDEDWKSSEDQAYERLGGGE